MCAWSDVLCVCVCVCVCVQIFDMAGALGFDMELLDIGGGFTGRFDASGNVMFGEIANTINAALAENFPPEMGVRVIAEPGRYFAETAATLLTPVYGHRDRIGSDGEVKKDYWITDGLYGSFNCIIYDGQNPEYQVRSSCLHSHTRSRPACLATRMPHSKRHARQQVAHGRGLLML